ncbi:isopeptide-forming domain-containing fimbrial protein [Nocardioides sp. KR10-350]|uniref:DUF7927 domain-containing protein n=1 Tax=Nocardioides cheoyonin TaxID=3156615 RepID=UPI0032B39706
MPRNAYAHRSSLPLATRRWLRVALVPLVALALSVTAMPVAAADEGDQTGDQSSVTLVEPSGDPTSNTEANGEDEDSSGGAGTTEQDGSDDASDPPTGTGESTDSDVPSGSSGGSSGTKSRGDLVRAGETETGDAEGPDPVDLPNLVGLTAADAEVTLTDLGLEWTVEYVWTLDSTQAGKVVEQTPATGTTVAAGTTVVLGIGVSDKNVVNLGVNRIKVAPLNTDCFDDEHFLNQESRGGTTNAIELNRIQCISTLDGSVTQVVDFSGLIPEETNGLAAYLDENDHQIVYFTSHYLTGHANAPEGGSRIYRYDFTTGELQWWSTPGTPSGTGDNLRVRRGAADPTTGVYYFSTSNDDPTTTAEDYVTHNLYAFRYAGSGSQAWYVGTIRTPSYGGQSGDFDFTASGDLIFVTGGQESGGNYAAHILVVSGQHVPSAPGSAIDVSATWVATIHKTGNGAGVAFGADGSLYLSDTDGHIWIFDPADWSATPKELIQNGLGGKGYSVDLSTMPPYFPSSLGSKPLTGAVTGSATFSRDYDWKVEKLVKDGDTWVSAAERKSMPNAGQTFDYKVVVTPAGPQDSGYVATGTVTLTNPNTADVPVTALTVKIGDETFTVAVPEGTTVPAKGSKTLDFKVTLTSAPATNATITASAVSGTGRTSASGALTLAESPTTVTDRYATVTDVFDNGTPSVTTDDVTDALAASNARLDATKGAKTYEYERTVTAGAAGATFTGLNEVTVTPSGVPATEDDPTGEQPTPGDDQKSGDLTDDAKVVVRSGQDLSVVKDVDASLVRTYGWDLEKWVQDADGTWVESTEKQAGADNKASFDYKVGVSLDDPDHADSDYVMKGTISVTNPNSWPVTVTKVIDTPSFGDAVTGCAVDGVDAQGGAVIPAGKTVEFDYTCDIAEGQAPSLVGTNNAAIEWNQAEAYSSSASDDYTVTVTEDDIDDAWTIAPVNQTVTVVDDKTDPEHPVVLGTVTRQADATLSSVAAQGVTTDGAGVFMYSLAQAGPAQTGIYTDDYVNTAWLTTTPDTPAAPSTPGVKLPDTEDSTTVKVWTPSGAIDKRVVSVSQNADFTWTIVYAIDVSNDSTANVPLTYDVKDKPDFGDGVTVNSVKRIDLLTATTLTPDADGIYTVAQAQTLRRGQHHVYLISVNASISAGASAVGFDNDATVLNHDTGVKVDEDDATATPRAPEVTKVAKGAVRVEGTNKWTVTYEVKVTNPTGQLLAYDLNDTPTSVDGTTATWSVSGPQELFGLWSVLPGRGTSALKTDWNGTAGHTQIATGTLPPGQTHTYTVTGVLTVAAGADFQSLGTDGLKNTAVVTNGVGTDNDNAEVKIDVDPANWSLTKESDPPTGSVVQPGDTVTYTVTVTNDDPTNPRRPQDVVITDDLSKVLEYATFNDGSITTSIGRAKLSADGSKLVWKLRALTGQATLEYTVTIHNDEDAYGKTINNLVTGTATTPDGPDEGTDPDPLPPTDDEPRTTTHSTPVPVTAAVTAAADYSRDYDWKVEKFVKDGVDEDGTDVWVPAAERKSTPGAEHAFEYKVVVTPTGPQDSGYVATGTVTLINPNDDAVPVTALTVKVGEKTVTVPVAEGTTVPANGSKTFDFTVELPGRPAADTAVSATAVTGTGTAPATGALPVASKPTTVTDQYATVTDVFDRATPEVKDDDITKTLAAGDARLDATKGAQTLTYGNSVTAGAAGTTLTGLNEVTVTPSGVPTTEGDPTGGQPTPGDDQKSVDLTDDAKVVVRSGQDLDVTKTAVGSLTRTYGWDLEKWVQDADGTWVETTEKQASARNRARFDYKVVVTPNSGKNADSNWFLTGEITVVNPNSWDVAASISDVPDFGVDDFACTLATDFTVPANDKVTVEYTCVFPSKPSLTGTNTATVIWNAAEAFSTGSKDTHVVDVSAAQWITTPANSTVTMVDDKTDPEHPVVLGTVTRNDDGTVSSAAARRVITNGAGVFTYSLPKHGPAQAGTYTDGYVNKAWLTTPDTPETPGEPAAPGTKIPGTEDSTTVKVYSPAGEVEKSVVSTTQNADKTWTVVYDVVVTNTSTEGVPLTYDLRDRFDFGAGVTAVNSHGVEVDTDAVKAHLVAGWDGRANTLLADAVTLAANEEGTASHTYTVTVNLTVNADVRFRNIATVSDDATDEPLDRDRATAKPASPSVNKVAGVPTRVGTTDTWRVVYMVEVENPSDQQLAYTLTDTPAALPKGVTLTGSWQTWGAVEFWVGQSARNTAWNGDTVTELATGVLPAGGKHTYTITGTVRVAPGADLTALATENGGLLNDAVVTNGVGKDEDDAVVKIDVDPANWSLTKTSDPTTGSVVKPGDTVTYTVTAENLDKDNPARPQDLVITDDLTEVLKYADFDDDSIEPSVGAANRSGTELVWTIRELAGEATLKYTVTIHKNEDAYGKTISNVVTATMPDGDDAGTDPDPLPPADDEPRSTTHNTPVPMTAEIDAAASFARDYDWKVEKSVDKHSAVVAEGDDATFTYQVTATPTGPQDSAAKLTGNVTLSNTNADPMTVGVKVTVPGGKSEEIAPVTVPANGSIKVPYVVDLASVPTEAVVATVTVTQPGAGGTTEADSSGTEFATPTVVTDRYVSVSDVFEKGTPTVIDDQLDAEEILASESGTWTSEEYTQKVGSELAAGNSEDYTNVATLTPVDEDGDPVLDDGGKPAWTDEPTDEDGKPTLPKDDTETVEVNVPSQWTLTKESDPKSGSTVKPGDTVTYTVTATNIGRDGKAAIQDVKITDDLSDVLKDADLVDDGGATFDKDAKTLTWTIASLAHKETLTYQVKVKDGAYGKTIGNVVTGTAATSDGSDPDETPDPLPPTNDRPSTTTHDTPGLPSVEKHGYKATDNGDTTFGISYDVTVANKYDEDAPYVLTDEPQPPTGLLLAGDEKWHANVVNADGSLGSEIATWSNGEMTIATGTLAPDESVTYRVSATVAWDAQVRPPAEQHSADAGTDGVLVPNTATVAADFDGDGKPDLDAKGKAVFEASDDGDTTITTPVYDVALREWTCGIWRDGELLYDNLHHQHSHDGPDYYIAALETQVGDIFHKQVRVFNQGTETVQIEEVVDYLPTGVALYTDPVPNPKDDEYENLEVAQGWTMRDGMAVYTPSEPIVLEPGAMVAIGMTTQITDAVARDTEVASYYEVSKFSAVVPVTENNQALYEDATEADPTSAPDDVTVSSSDATVSSSKSSDMSDMGRAVSNAQVVTLSTKVARVITGILPMADDGLEVGDYAAIAATDVDSISNAVNDELDQGAVKMNEINEHGVHTASGMLMADQDEDDHDYNLIRVVTADTSVDTSDEAATAGSDTPDASSTAYQTGSSAEPTSGSKTGGFLPNTGNPVSLALIGASLLTMVVGSVLLLISRRKRDEQEAEQEQ